MFSNVYSKLAIFAVLLMTFSNSANAQSFNRKFVVTPQEKQTHAQSIRRMSPIVRNCLKADLTKHRKFMRKYGISAFYGSNSSFSKKSDSERRNFLRSIGKDPSLVDQMNKTSCIGLAIKCYERGFQQTGQADMWKRVMQYASENGWDGSAIIEAFRELGWYVLYWNPDTSLNKQYDDADKARNPTNKGGTWAYNAYRLLTVKRYNKYYKNTVDDSSTLVNFGENPSDFLRYSPMMIGVAHSGYHVFPGYSNVIIEGHSTRGIQDPNTVEASYFNPLGYGGGPRGRYLSGIIAVPPGAEPR